MATVLFGHPLSGNTHKIRLLLSALSVSHEERLVDVTKGEHKDAALVALNPRGQLPVLVDGDTTIFDAQAILVYLARSRDPRGAWLPPEAAELGRVVGWLSFAANEIHSGLHLARIHFLLGANVAIEEAQGRARDSLRLLDAHLATRTFLELDRPTVADLACFPCVALAGEAKVDLAPFPHVRAWIDRIRALPFFVPMAGIPRR